MEIIGGVSSFKRCVLSENRLARLAGTPPDFWKLWAMFDKKGGLCFSSAASIKDNPSEVIEWAESRFGNSWRDIHRHYGYRLEKVVVLRESEFEQLMKEAGR